MDITVYSKSGCVQSFYVTKYLEKKRINFIEKIVNRNDSFLHEIREMGYRSIPVTMIEEREAIVGYDPKKLADLVAAIYE